MNDPIVSPWLVYLIMQVDAVNELLFVAALFAGVAMFPYMVGFVVKRSGTEDEFTRAMEKCKFIPILFMLLFPLAVLFPNQKTIIAMIVAKHITPQTVEQGVDVVKQVKDELKVDVMDVINALTQESTQVEKETP